MTKFQLFGLLAAKNPKPQEFHSSGDFYYTGILQSIQREDGSGSSFNVTITTGDYSTVVFHLRTID